MASAKVESLTVCCCSGQQELKQDLHPTVRGNYFNSHSITALQFRKKWARQYLRWCHVHVMPKKNRCPRRCSDSSTSTHVSAHCWKTKKVDLWKGNLFDELFLENVDEIFKHHGKKNQPKSFKTVPLSKALTKCLYTILLLGKLVARNVLHTAELWKKNFIQQSTNIYTNKKKHVLSLFP